MKTEDAIEKLSVLIQKTDFSAVSFPRHIELDDQALIQVLTDYIKKYLSESSMYHPIVSIAHNYFELDISTLPLNPVFQLKALAIVLYHLNILDGRVANGFKRNLARYRKYPNVMFELEVGFLLKKNDPELEFYEVENPDKESVPDYLGKAVSGKKVWVDAFVREREKSFFDYFELDQNHAPIPKSGEEISEIMKDFVRTTSKTIARKKKPTVADDEVFVGAARIRDGYSSQSLNYQALVNDLPPNNVIAIFSRPMGFLAGEQKAVDNIKLYFNHNHSLSDDEIKYIRSLFCEDRRNDLA